VTLDLIIHGGRVVDGTGSPAGDRRADIGIENETIVAIGNLAMAEAHRRLDATGCMVAPGFVDIHSHSDFTLLVDPRARSAISQGVTSEVVGNCGHGCAPIPDVDTVKHNIYGYSADVPITWTSMDGYLARLAASHPAVNVATLAPNGNLRLAAMGLEDRPARPDERRHMVRLLEESLDAGAVGFSTGLEYATERATLREDLLDLCRTAAQRGGWYATHTRNLDIHALAAIEEVIDVARETGVPLQISHIIPRYADRDGDWQTALELVDAARADGVEVTFDAHTRVHGTTNVSAMLPPSELAYRGPELVARLRDPEIRAAIKRYPSLIAAWGLAGWDRAFLLSCPHRPDWVGKSFAELAGAGQPDSGYAVDPMDAMLDVLIVEADDPTRPMAYSHSRDEEWLLGTMRHPLCMVGSDAIDLATDGPLAGTTFLGAYTWVGWYLRRLVRETATLTWDEAIHRLTDLPARRAGLRWRGRLAEGYFADVVAFDPEAVSERANLDDPNRYAAGFVHVVVNGTPAMENGAFCGARTGQVLRRAA
jgi:N-acyl-D-aspartate/D-glutamate deacylase